MRVKHLLAAIGFLMQMTRLLAQPSIVTPPTNQIVLNGGTGVFTVEVSGAAPFTYQWRFKGTNLPNNIITTVAGNGSTAFSGDGGSATNASLNGDTGVAVDQSGNIYIADTAHRRVRKVDTNGIITTYAGNGVLAFSGDGGVATNAGIIVPFGLTVDSQGNLFVSDNGNYRIRKIDTNGIITTVAGTGTAGYSGDGGAATNAKVKAPRGVVVDVSGNLFIADYSNYNIRKVDTNGIITTVAGKNASGFSTDGGLATNANLTLTTGVVADGNGNFFIADSETGRIRKVDTNGIITTVAGTGTLGYAGDGGAATNADINFIQGIAIDQYGYLFIADASFHVRQVDSSGIITTIGGNGDSSFSGDEGAATNAGLRPYGMALDGAGSLLVADQGAHRVRKIKLGHYPYLQLAAVNTNNAGDYDVIIADSTGGSVTSSVVSLTIAFPPQITVQPQDAIVINGDSASFNLTATGDQILKYQWFATTPLEGETNATLNFSNASTNLVGGYFCVITNLYGSVTSRVAVLNVALQPTNLIVLAGDVSTFELEVFGNGPLTFQWQLNGTNLPHGNSKPDYKDVNTVITLAGNGSSFGFTPDGQLAVFSPINNKYGVAGDSVGRVYFDDSNSRIRRIDTNGFIYTVAGKTGTGYSGDGGMGTNATLSQPKGIAVDSAGNVFFADTGNHRVRKVDTSGIITTVAGTNGFGSSGDGGAAITAKLSSPSTVAVDVSGNLFIADTGNNRIRKVDTNGIITTVAGTNSFGFSGDGGPAVVAKLNQPYGVAVDGFGNFFISDTFNNRIRKVDGSGIITTIAGTNTTVFSGDGGPAVVASLNQPYGLAIDAFGEIAIADYANNRIRLIDADGIIKTIAAGGPFNLNPTTNASLSFPTSVNFDFEGNLLIADQGHHALRKLDLWRLPTYSFPITFPFHAGTNFSVLITSPYGSVTSSVVTLTVVSIYTQPHSVMVRDGESAVFKINAVVSDATPLNYQWFFNGDTLLDGETNTTLAIAGVTTNEVGNYHCKLTVGNKSFASRSASLAIGVPPRILSSPTNATLIGGNSAVFSVVVSGTGPLKYQWQLNGTNLPNNIITTVAGTGVGGFSGDGGPATNATFSNPIFVSTDAKGSLFVTTSDKQVRKIDTNGIITTIVSGYPSTLGGVMVDSFGNMFISFDSWNFIYKVDTNGLYSYFAGQGPGYFFSGDGGPASRAAMNHPSGITFDSDDNLFIADKWDQRVRKIDILGIITTVAGRGNPGVTGDGGLATNADLSAPNSVAKDVEGNLFIADSDNNKVRKVNTSGIITTVAGNGTTNYIGDGGLAINAGLGGPRDVAVDPYGNLFIADYDNHCIRMVDTNGIISTVAGNGISGYSGDFGPATNASLAGPNGIRLDASGNLFIADFGTNVVRKVAFGGSPTRIIPNLETNMVGNYSVIVTSPFGSATGLVSTVTVILPPQHFTASLNNVAAQLQFTGTPGWPYILQTATNLSPPVAWQSVVTNSADPDGNWSFCETNFIIPQRFYRVLPGTAP